MKNPWEEIDLNAYENHMSLDDVFQLQALNKMMKDQFYTYPARSVMILGVAGGNGLEHIDKSMIHRVYGVDINKENLDTCTKRYPELWDIFDTIHADLTQEKTDLPHADLIIANLVVEYIGYECFQKVIKQISPKYVSVVIQINIDTGFVSDSPYLHVFDRLNKVHHQMEVTALIEFMGQIGYRKVAQIEEELPNGKKLARIDFAC